MIVLKGITYVPKDARNGVLAIGNFDGVHRGHQVLLQSAKDRAAELKAPAGVILFEPHPREFFQPDKPHFRLTPLKRKLELLNQLGLDLAVVLTFDATLANLTAQDFIERVIVDALAARHVVIGYNFRFGKARTGDAEAMRRAGSALGFGVTVVAQVGEGGEVFSSGAVRAALAQGDVARAAHILGHWWRVSGAVIGGFKRGTGLGFPTANIALPPGTELAHGIYAVRVYADGRTYGGGAYLGSRPTFDDGVPMLEVFLFGFDGDLYGREIAVEFVDYVRADAKFASVEALKEQIAEDCAQAQAALEAAPASPLDRP
ncbi:MAG TPA: bifunctional riboflavin kinase/FAD synthetase [Hyphomicrobiaceae bacterium]|jgi:riboflavin kinase/FMN adenylyltransferase|nr:bifunctional riboflavin kinase/FAD synthetase [Hyphomicrobiaceae bacterium]